VIEIMQNLAEECSGTSWIEAVVWIAFFILLGVIAIAR
jgi:hypothetical protein